MDKNGNEILYALERSTEMIAAEFWREIAPTPWDNVSELILEVEALNEKYLKYLACINGAEVMATYIAATTDNFHEVQQSFVPVMETARTTLLSHYRVIMSKHYALAGN